MLISMTGYGRAAESLGMRTITIEMKSVNNRYLDIDFSLPKPLGYLEEQLKAVIMEHVKRGKVNVNVTIDGEPITETLVDIDWNLVEQYQLHMNAMIKKYNAAQWNVADMLLLPGIIKQTEKQQSNLGFEPAIISVLRLALDQLVKMRVSEGQNLKRDFCERLSQISQTIEEIRHSVPRVIEKYQSRLVNKINEFLDGRFELDEARLMNEVAIYADKSDISEELLRLDSHLQQFLDIIDEDESKGRKLDFLVQEMNREINTIGSKSNDAMISRHVVSIKSELEKIREQVQNIE
jgi:uncharacterized protein (TIGR00255 family)